VLAYYYASRPIDRVKWSWFVLLLLLAGKGLETAILLMVEQTKSKLQLQPRELAGIKFMTVASVQTIMICYLNFLILHLHEVKVAVIVAGRFRLCGRGLLGNDSTPVCPFSNI
jgi:hypothetical protein